MKLTKPYKLELDYESGRQMVWQVSSQWSVVGLRHELEGYFVRVHAEASVVLRAESDCRYRENRIQPKYMACRNNPVSQSAAI
jgi:hypothetical protein